MTAPDTIEFMRHNAQLEREALIEHRARGGEDPAEFMAEIPSVDELVVSTILSERMHVQGLAAEYSLARLAGKSSVHDASEHRHNADLLEAQMLHRIAQAYPELSTAVWIMLGKLNV
ncbi:hypothetical protein [Lysinibacter sp. HNR]|uniref:hypothetical protein n=1 Tax=Lysinibacter sp. HNR TaxID=3031408 RepID=UPI002435177E|nr:hypothetical protein [Lysinibacter sp. HNR]WGD37700.1 hypothetical protein FrondiHNR_01950 [Lysinibacter sp. HNR]